MPLVEQLAGAFRSAEETSIPELGRIKGDIPSWLRGSLMITGPAKWDFNGFTLTNWLDGCCMLSKFVIANENSVSMERKFLRTEYYKGLMKTGKPLVMTFGTRAFPDERKNLLSRLISNYIIMEQSDNCSGLAEYGPNLVTAGETCFSYQLDPVTLDLIGEKLDTNKSLGLLNVLCHAQRDASGDVFTIGGSVTAGGCKTNLIRTPNPAKNGNKNAGKMKEVLKKSEIKASWSNRNPTAIPLMHSFGITENYAVHIEMPYYMTLLGVMSSTVKGHSFKDLLKWHPEERNRFIVVEKRTGRIDLVEIVGKDPFICTHVINAYEEDDHIVMDMIVYPDSSFFEPLSLCKLRQKVLDHSSPGQPTRFVIPLNGSKKIQQTGKNLVTLDYTTASAHSDGQQLILCGESICSYTGVDNPTINPHFAQRSYDIYYAAHPLQAGFLGRVGKFNVKTKEAQIWEESSSCLAGSPIFIPSPLGGTHDEDNGVLISAITSTNENKPSFLLVLDAKTFKEMARIEFNSQIPCHMHAHFINTPEL